MFRGGSYRFLAGIIWIVFCCAIIGAGIRTILQARDSSSWDPSVTKMTYYSGIFGVLVGIALLWFGFTQLSMFGIFLW